MSCLDALHMEISNLPKLSNGMTKGLLRPPQALAALCRSRAIMYQPLQSQNKKCHITCYTNWYWDLCVASQIKEKCKCISQHSSMILCVTPKHMWKLQFKLNAHLLKLNVYSILVNSSYSMHSVITRYSSLGEMYCGGSPFIGAPSLVPL